MKAIVRESGMEQGMVYRDIAPDVVKPGDVKIRMVSAGLNHRDLFVVSTFKSNGVDTIIGSDGAGVIEEVGENVSNFNTGDEVVINPSLNWFEGEDAPPADFRILGFPDHGTFANYIVISADQIEKKPSYLSWEEAGVLPLAALTGYRALFTRAKAEAGKTIFIPGIGGGVATMMLQFAKAVGCKVIVSSRSKNKRERALELGADYAFDTNEDWIKELKNEQVDIVIDTIGKATINQAFKVLMKGGALVNLGATTGDDLHLNLRDFFFGQYNFLGTTMGNRHEFREMLRFIEKHNIRPVVDKVYPLEKTKKAMDYLDKAAQFGKVGLLISEHYE